MQPVQFAVSAKMARLIGRENISDVQGALIELIKNTYDADASCVYVDIDMPFPSVPQSMSFDCAIRVFGTEGVSEILSYYERGNSAFEKKITLNNEQERQLERLLFSKNRISVIDNGHGMGYSEISSAWMNIGTSGKTVRKASPKGRIYTGSKGIGRFALDKLSMKTTVFTQRSSKSLYKWSIDWEQFETASMLDEIVANIDTCSSDFMDLAVNLAGKRIKTFGDHDWSTGTLIQLCPTREPWTPSFYEAFNRNLKSLYPQTGESQFDVYVYNHYYPEYSYANDRFSLRDSEYDYKITATFDGEKDLKITLHRNEADTRKRTVTVKFGEVSQNIAIGSFWAREKFKEQYYRRDDYAKAIDWTYDATTLLRESPAALADIGPFETELYFIKLDNSNVEFTKPVVSSRRRKIRDNYSGIKLYRDGFKVRPYGEEGSGYDWLGLGGRQQRSPASVSHPGGSWRVVPYQISGAVYITRDENPNLTDMANREGLAINGAYSGFVKMLIKIIETFEYDRHIIFREYALWLEQLEREHSRTGEIISKATSKKESGNKENEKPCKDDDPDDSGYTDAEYEAALSLLKDEKTRLEQATQTMMLFSSTGVMTNTFSHEIKQITTNVGSNMQHMRRVVKRLLGAEGYIGDPYFDPLPIIDEAEKTDRLLENWLSVIMEGISTDAFKRKTASPQSTIRKILDLWAPLLAMKRIAVNPLQCIDINENSTLYMSEIEFYIIINNFILNSAWFLEKADVEQREITTTLSDRNYQLILDMENNGLPLDDIFANNPGRIFEAGVTSKSTKSYKGTGLGLWIMRTVVENNSGQILISDKRDGFGLRIFLPK